MLIIFMLFQVFIKSYELVFFEIMRYKFQENHLCVYQKIGQ